MTGGEIVMEETDRDWIKSLFKAELTPLRNDITQIKTDIKALPCSDHAVKIAKNATRIANGREHNRDTQAIKNDSKDFVLKTITVGGTILLVCTVVLGFLHKVGFFKALAK